MSLGSDYAETVSLGSDSEETVSLGSDCGVIVSREDGAVREIRRLGPGGGRGGACGRSHSGETVDNM